MLCCVAFSGAVRRGEFFTLQVALHAPETRTRARRFPKRAPSSCGRYVPRDQPPLANVSLAYIGFPAGVNFTCFNEGGVGADGEPLAARVAVPAGQASPSAICGRCSPR